MTPPNIDATQIMNLYGTNGFNAQGAINLAGSAIGGQSYNEIAWFSNAMMSGTTEEKIQSGTQFGFKFLMSLFGSNEQNEIASETAKNEAQASNIEAARQNAAEKTQQAVEQITSSIEANIENLQNLLATIEEKNEEKEEYQQQIQTCLQTIETNEQILNDPNASKEEKAAALQAISGVSATITELSGKINDLIESIETFNTEVTEIGELNDDLNNQAVQVTDAGVAQQQQYQQELTGVNTANQAIQVRAAKDEAIGAAATTMAATMSTTSTAASAIPVVGALFGSGGQAMAAKLQQVGTDYSGAGTTGIASFALVNPLINNVSGLISGDLTKFASFPTSVGSLVDNGSSVSYEFFNISNAIGSDLENASGIEEEAQAINEAVTVAANELETTEEDNASGQVIKIETTALEELSA